MSKASPHALLLVFTMTALLWPGHARAGDGVSAGLTTGSLSPTTASLPVRFEIQEQTEKPVIDLDHPDIQDNKYGFEGGTTVKVGATYHLFVSEMAGDPFWMKMRLAHWTSPDARQWKRLATIKETSGKKSSETGLPYESVFSPIIIFNEKEDQWDLFHYYYDTKNGGWFNRMSSTVKGREGINGPFKDVGAILPPGSAPTQPWESVNCVDSFYPYQAGDRWYAFYGSADGKSWWRVGLAEAPALAGPWTRRATGNPAPLEPIFIENPIVTRVGKGFVAVYDCTNAGAPTYQLDGHDIGYSWSPDGIHWLPGAHLAIQPEGPANWSKDIRTPLGLVDEGNGVYTLLYTGLDKQRQFWPVGLVRLKLVQ